MEKRRCITCGAEFDVCPRCEQLSPDILAEYGHIAWRAVACCYECWQIYSVLRKYGYNQISKAEARAILRGIDIPIIHSDEINLKILEILEDDEAQEQKEEKATYKRVKK